MAILIVGLVAGFLFGYFLQKGGILKYETQLDAMQLRSFTIFKFMMSAMITGSVGLHILKGFGFIDFNPEPFSVFGVIIGGLIFGIGWGLLGSCPGTDIGSIGTGRIDTIWGLLGLIAGSIIFSFIYEPVSKLYNSTIIGNISLFGDLSPLIAVPLFVTLIILFFKFLKRIGL